MLKRETRGYRNPPFFILCTVFLMTFVCFIMFGPSRALADSKISVSPATTTVNEGSSDVFSIMLNEPIIPNTPPAYLDINVTSSDPSRLSIDPNPVVYTASDWYAVETFTVNALPNDVYGDSEAITLTLTADSNSEYYNGFVTTSTILINDTTPAPSQPQPQAKLSNDPPTIDKNTPDTGFGEPKNNSPVYALASGMLVMLCTGLFLRRHSKSSK